MVRRLAAAAAASLLGGAVMLSGTAQADINPASAWEPIDTAAGGAQSASAHSTIVDPTTAEATWKDGEDASAAGTSIETGNLGVAVEAGVEVTVGYELLDGADPGAGSVRMFLYYSPDADTWSQAPDQFVAAPDDGSTSGELTITTDQEGTVGTMGLVYDTSNGGVEGTVRFTNLTIDGETALFRVPDQTLDPAEVFASLNCEDDLDSVKAEVEEVGVEAWVAQGNSEVNFEPELTVAHVEAYLERCEPDDDAGEGGSLPATSGLTSLSVLLGGAALLLVAGGVLLLVRRRNVPSVD